MFKIKLCGDPTLENQDIFEFRISLFDNGKLEEFLLFVHNLKMTIDAPGTLTDNLKLWYIYVLYYLEEHYLRLILCVIKLEVRQ